MKRISPEEYQNFTLTTWTGDDSGQSAEMRIVLGICEEAGEVAGKVKKWYRGDFNDNSQEFRDSIQAELGDLLWYVAMLHNFYDLELEETMVKNVEKLVDRQDRGVIGGSGDVR